jgi:hypothetical protein
MENKNNLAQFIYRVSGYILCVICVTATVVAAIRTGDFLGTHLIGDTYFYVGEFIEGWYMQVSFWLLVSLVCRNIFNYNSPSHNKIKGCNK